MNIKKLLLLSLISIATIVPCNSFSNMYDPRSIALLFAGFHMTKHGCQQLAQNTKKPKNEVPESTGKKIKNTVTNIGLIGTGLGLMLTAPYCVSYIDKKLGSDETTPTQDNIKYFLGGAAATLLTLFTFKNY